MRVPDFATPAVRKLNRNIAIAGSVILFHIGALWALQTGLLRRTVEILIPVQILAETITPPAPKVEPAPPPPAPKPPEPVKQPVARKVQPTLPPAPKPAAIPEAPVAPTAPTGVVEPQPVAPPSAGVAPVGAEPGPAAPGPGPAKVELPSSNASYLQNPAPVYPPISKRLGEQGKVVVRVLIGADGSPRQAELKYSSGYDRLDQAAIGYVMRCRYVPGRIGGVPQAMWYEAPVNFVLQ